MKALKEVTHLNSGTSVTKPTRSKFQERMNYLFLEQIRC